MAPEAIDHPTETNPPAARLSADARLAAVGNMLCHLTDGLRALRLVARDEDSWGNDRRAREAARDAVDWIVRGLEADVTDAFRLTDRCDHDPRLLRVAGRTNETSGSPPLPPLKEPVWLPAARAEGARLASQGLRRELGFTHGDVALIRWLAGRVAEADGAEAGARLLTLAGVEAKDAPA